MNNARPSMECAQFVEVGVRVVVVDDIIECDIGLCN